MTQKKDIEGVVERDDDNFSQEESMMEDGQDHDPNSHSISPYINAIQHPASIFQSNRGPPRLDHYFKIKWMDKPKDTLEYIHAKKQAFKSYVNQPSRHHQQTHQHYLQNYSQPTARIKQQFPQFTFYKKCKTNFLLFVRITNSRIGKCNISITNLRGEVLRYYPNVILSKKQGKIINFVGQNKDIFLFVFDYTKDIGTVAKLPSILNAIPLLYYKLVKINIDNSILSKVEQKLQKGQLVLLKNSTLIAKSQKLCSKSMLPTIKKAYKQIKFIQAQQNTFLTQTRGRKEQANRILAFDMMMIALWKQYKLVGQSLINKIISLFDLTQATLSQMEIKQPQTFHTSHKMPQAQNCCFCLSTNLQMKRPRRTRIICQRCSAQKEKLIYLCRSCFNPYHSQNELYQFKKNQRKGKRKIKILARKLGKKYAVRNLPNEAGYHQIQERPTENQMILQKLDKKCDQFFQKIEQLIEERSLASSEYYLTMLMNMTILQTHKYITKVCKRQEEGIKLQHD